MKISGEIVAMALNATEWHRSQIQGFTYTLDDGARQMHIVRDMHKGNEKPTIWAETADTSEYEAAHRRMLIAQERARAEVLAERINLLMSAIQ
jgi:hypothetical protein